MNDIWSMWIAIAYTNLGGCFPTSSRKNRTRSTFQNSFFNTRWQTKSTNQIIVSAFKTGPYEYKLSTFWFHRMILVTKVVLNSKQEFNPIYCNVWLTLCLSHDLLNSSFVQCDQDTSQFKCTLLHLFMLYTVFHTFDKP